MNNYIGLCRLSAWLDSFPYSHDLVPLLPILSNRHFSKVHRPRGSFDIGSSFWDLSHKVGGALFFLSFDSRSYARTTHPPSPVVPESTFIVSRRRTCSMQPDGLFCSQIVNFLPGFVQPRQLLFFSGFEVDHTFIYLIRTFWYRMSRWIALFGNVSRNGSSFDIVCILCYFFVDQ